MDGYAVVADCTEGATAYNRITFKVIGDALPGSPFDSKVNRDEAVRIMTGAPMPAGSDAVLPAEWVEVDSVDSDVLAAVSTVSPGKHVGRRGEDIVAGTTVLGAGRILRPQDLGVMSSIGLAHVAVVRRPRVRLVITGNELLPSGSTPHGVQITDANGPMLAALAERDGASVDFPGLVRDDGDAILAQLHADADVVIVSGGSSVGIEDLAPTLVAKHGDLAVHGIAMRPSSPTGMGTIGSRLGRSKEWPYRSVRGTLTRKISSPIGRLDYARVRIEDGRVEPLSVAGASVLSSTTRADGFVIVADDSEGFAAGADVDVWLYGPHA
jgi:molybdopterin molybdotransferase